LTIFFIITFDFFQFARNETLAWAARRASRSLTRRALAAWRVALEEADRARREERELDEMVDVARGWLKEI
jgi:hypothetical protein